MNTHLKLAYDYGVQRALEEAGITKTANKQLMNQYIAQGMHPQDAMDKAYPDVVRDKAIYDATRGGTNQIMNALGQGDTMDMIRDAALLNAINQSATGTSQVNRQNFKTLLDRVQKSNKETAAKVEGRRASDSEIANTARLAGAGGGLLGAGSGALVGGGLGAVLGESLGYDSARSAGLGAILGGLAGGGLGGYAGHSAVKTIAD